MVKIKNFILLLAMVLSGACMVALSDAASDGGKLVLLTVYFICSASWILFSDKGKALLRSLQDL